MASSPPPSLAFTNLLRSSFINQQDFWPIKTRYAIVFVGPHYKTQKCLTFLPPTIFSDRNVKDGINWIVNKNFTCEKKFGPLMYIRVLTIELNNFNALFFVTWYRGLWIDLGTFSILYSRRYAKTKSENYFSAYCSCSTCEEKQQWILKSIHVVIVSCTTQASTLLIHEVTTDS
jgi:hypothetical protein